MNIFFITGTSGSGKTTLVTYLKARLPQTLFEIYDFDEKGVPPNADTAWRKETTDYWLMKAQKNNEQNKSTIICGVTVPSEIVSSVKKPAIPIYFGLIKVDDETIKQRLTIRGWNDQLIQDNSNWARYLEAEVKKQTNHYVVDTACYDTPEEIADVFVKWIYLAYTP
ncbi:AAA family ATPase [Candidatus Dependentiae bacterium]|nr:AAA family ATPase [Candidatus Dependentiae bacterium]